MSSSSKELSKFEKEKQKLIQEKCQGLLNEMLRDDDNKYCVDCDAKGPRWASWNLGIFLCIRCAGIHRNLGVHISRVKSVNLDSWTPEQVVTMQQMGNSRARAVYEANLPDNFRRPQTDVALENFIRAKYEHTKYIAQEWVKPAAPRVDWNAEVEEQIRKKKEKKSADAAAGAMLPKFGAGLASSRLNSSKATSASKSSNNSSSSSNNHHSKSIAPPPLGKIEVPQPVTAQAAVTTASSASEDLLGLTTLSSPTSDDPFASPVKNNSHQVPSGAAVSAAPSTTAQESKSNEEELGAVFTQDPISQQKMTKESILSLYGSLGGGGGGGGTGMVGGGLGGIQMPSAAVPAGAAVAANNPFGQFMGASSNTNHQQQSTNPFPTSQQGIFSDLIGNGFGGGGLVGVGMGAPAPAATNQVQQSNLSQLQQGLFSLNLGSASTPLPQQQQQQPPQPHLQQQSNSNLLFNSPPPPSTNLNMLMMNNSSGGGGMGSGYFGGGGGSTTTGFIGMGAPQQQQQPGSLMMTSAPQQHNFQQFQQQQPHQFNQFNQFQQAASSPFQNGGTPAAATTVAAAAATAGGGLLGAGSNSDLLWK